VEIAIGVPSVVFGLLREVVAEKMPARPHNSSGAIVEVELSGSRNRCGRFELCFWTSARSNG
jgi:hypothetical protein